MSPDQARALFLDQCQPGDRGNLERHGEKAAVAALTAFADGLDAVANSIRFRLRYDLVGRNNTSMSVASSPAAKTSGFVVAEIPDWQLRQWLAAIEGRPAADVQEQAA